MRITLIHPQRQMCASLRDLEFLREETWRNRLGVHLFFIPHASLMMGTCGWRLLQINSYITNCQAFTGWTHRMPKYRLQKIELNLRFLSSTSTLCNALFDLYRPAS